MPFVLYLLALAFGACAVGFSFIPFSSEYSALWRCVSLFCMIFLQSHDYCKYQRLLDISIVNYPKKRTSIICDIFGTISILLQKFPQKKLTHILHLVLFTSKTDSHSLIYWPHVFFCL